MHCFSDQNGRCLPYAPGAPRLRPGPQICRPCTSVIGDGANESADQAIACGSHLSGLYRFELLLYAKPDAYIRTKTEKPDAEPKLTPNP